MRLKDLITVYVYSPVRKKNQGESSTKWIYKDSIEVNKQQNLTQLDLKPSGEVDYETIKLLIDKDINLEKGDGITFKELKLKDNIAQSPPSFTVKGSLEVGKSITYTCNAYNGE